MEMKVETMVMVMWRETNDGHPENYGIQECLWWCLEIQECLWWCLELSDSFCSRSKCVLCRRRLTMHLKKAFRYKLYALTCFLVKSS